MNPCFVVNSKFWPYHQNATVEIKTHLIRHPFSNLLLSNFCEPVWIVTSVPHGNFEVCPLGVAMGNAVSVTRVWNIHTKTQPIGQRQPMTSLPARPQYKATRNSGPTAVEARRRMKSWGSQLDLADELERELPFLQAHFCMYSSDTGHADGVPHSDP